MRASLYMSDPVGLREQFQEAIEVVCPICLAVYNEGRNCPMMICYKQHNMCNQCFLKFIQKNQPICPECRQPIFQDVVGKNRLLLTFLAIKKGIQTKAVKLQEEIKMLLGKNTQLSQILQHFELKINQATENMKKMEEQNVKYKEIQIRLREELKKCRKNEFGNEKENKQEEQEVVQNDERFHREKILQAIELEMKQFDERVRMSESFADLACVSEKIQLPLREYKNVFQQMNEATLTQLNLQSYMTRTEPPNTVYKVQMGPLLIQLNLSNNSFGDRGLTILTSVKFTNLAYLIIKNNKISRIVWNPDNILRLTFFRFVEQFTIVNPQKYQRGFSSLDSSSWEQQLVPYIGIFSLNTQAAKSCPEEQPSEKGEKGEGAIVVETRGGCGDGGVIG